MNPQFFQGCIKLGFANNARGPNPFHARHFPFVLVLVLVLALEGKRRKIEDEDEDEDEDDSEKPSNMPVIIAQVLLLDAPLQLFFSGFPRRG